MNAGRGLQRSADWIGRRSPRLGKSVLRLFCIHHAGGTSSAFNGWDSLLDPRIEMCAVRLPGRGVRFAEGLISDAQQMVTAMLKGLLPYMDVPFALFGHSMGALLAYELTMRLRAQRMALPRLLAVSARPAPDMAVAQRFRAASRLPDEDLLALLSEANAGTSGALSDESLRRLLLPVVRADFHLCETWQPRFVDPLDVPVAAFGGANDPWVQVESVRRWKLHTRSSFTFTLLPGDHFCFQPGARDICRVIESLLMGELNVGAAFPSKDATTEATELGA